MKRKLMSCVLVAILFRPSKTATAPTPTPVEPWPPTDLPKATFIDLTLVASNIEARTLTYESYEGFEIPEFVKVGLLGYRDGQCEAAWEMQGNRISSNELILTVPAEVDFTQARYYGSDNGDVIFKLQDGSNRQAGVQTP